MKINPRYITESLTLATANPLVLDPLDDVKEAAVADVRVSELQAIYPMTKVMHTGRLTDNYRYFEAKEGRGKDDPEQPTGYRSMVKPYGKPILREHRLHDGIFGSSADEPLGRIFWAAYRKRKSDEIQTLPKNKYKPGTVEGDGYSMACSIITDPTTIQKVLGYSLHTVSIGGQIARCIESTTGLDLIDLYDKGEELPDRQPGKIYKVGEGKEERMCFYYVEGLSINEVSYVNRPADTSASNVNTNVGEEGVRFLLGEKKSGLKEFAFFDASTLQKVHLNDVEEAAWASSFDFVESLRVGHNIWVTRNKVQEAAEHYIQESFQTEYAFGDVIQFKIDDEEISGQIVGIYRDSVVPKVCNGTIQGTPTKPAYRVRELIYKEKQWVPGERSFGVPAAQFTISSEIIEGLTQKFCTAIQENTDSRNEAEAKPVAEDEIKSTIKRILNGEVH